MAFKDDSGMSFDELLKKGAILYLEEEISLVPDEPFNPSHEFVLKMKKLFE